MRKIYTLVIVFLSIISSGFSISENNKSITTDTIYASITPAQANDTINAYINDPWFVILDVRTVSEYAAKHIAEGVVIDFYSSSFASTLATLNRNKKYVLHCATGGRSGQVFTMMQNLHFTKVYNMTGGLNSWVSNGLPVTTTEGSVLDILSDSIAFFNNIPMSQTDSIPFTITNAANLIVSFDSITDLSSTEFSTNFNLSDTILGARDLSFNIYYNPTDTVADSTMFSVFSNGGIITIYLNGTANGPTSIGESKINTFQLFNDLTNKIIQFNLPLNNEQTSIRIIDLNGKTVYTQIQNNDRISIHYSDWKKSIYLLQIATKNGSQTFKLPLIY